jgi:hypothetical protein
MEAVLGSGLGVFIGVTVILFGFAAMMTGQALASTWRPAWNLIPYMLMVAAAARFLSFALFDAVLLSVGGFVIGAIILMAIAMLSYRATRARQMVTQYPWLYERAGLFGWRDRTGGGTAEA